MVRNTSRGSKSAARTPRARSRTQSRLRRLRSVRRRKGSPRDILEEQQIGERRDADAAERPLRDHEVRFRPEADVRHLLGDTALDRAKELEPPARIQGGGRFLEERIR